MEEGIYHFKVNDANVFWGREGLRIILDYPSPDKLQAIVNKRLPEQLDYGINVFNQLLYGNNCALAADSEHPLKPSCGGSLCILSDNVLVCHRRDIKARVHKMYHSPNGGYTESREFTHSLKGLEKTALRESAEETILVTRDKNSQGKPWLIVPKDMKEETIMSARRLGIELPIKEVEPEIISGKDRLRVYENGKELFVADKICLSLLYESSTSLTTLWIRKIPISSSEVFPVDLEGMNKGDKYIHFNREAYLIPFKEVADKKFGTPLENFESFQLDKIESGVPILRKARNDDLYGPEGVRVNHPDIWAPEDMMVNCLANLGSPVYSGAKRFELELEKIKARKEGRTLVPTRYLAGQNS